MNRPAFIMLVGIPGSGKTSYANNLPGRHLSSDLIRKEIYGDESIQGDPSEVFAIMHERTLETLDSGMGVIYDATNLTRKDRASILDKLPSYVSKVCHVVWAPIETCIDRDLARDRTVGKEVIDRLLKRFQAPYYDEGFDYIYIHLPVMFDREGYYRQIIDSICIPHDNPHHSSSICAHCDETGARLLGGGAELRNAGYWHDIGKAYVKSFKDSKGNDTDIAHYYQHQNVGAWMSYGIRGITPYIAWLISNHMEPFSNSKYYNRLPGFLKKELDLLHEADLNAH